MDFCLVKYVSLVSVKEPVFEIFLNHFFGSLVVVVWVPWNHLFHLVLGLNDASLQWHFLTQVVGCQFALVHKAVIVSVPQFECFLCSSLQVILVMVVRPDLHIRVFVVVLEGLRLRVLLQIRALVRWLEPGCICCAAIILRKWNLIAGSCGEKCTYDGQVLHFIFKRYLYLL